MESCPTRRWVSVPATAILVVTMLTKGADLGVRGLYVVCVALGLSIVAFLFGQGPESIRPDGINLTATIQDPDAFGTVFATCFPAFTGMIAGLGLSGDLKRPQRSIPVGTIGATIAGMLIYSLVAVKLAKSATPEALADDVFIMSQIALWGPAIYVGLASAALSSALGSILVAPRTLQALAKDKVFPSPTLNEWLAAGRGGSEEPVYATYVSGGLAVLFVLIGDNRFHRALAKHVLHGDLRCLVRCFVSRVFLGRSFVQAHIPHSLVFLADRCRDVRDHDDRHESIAGASRGLGHGCHLHRSEAVPAKRARPYGDPARDDVSTHAPSADRDSEKPHGLYRCTVAAVCCRHHTAEEIWTGTVRLAALDLPSSRLWPLHPIHPG